MQESTKKTMRAVAIDRFGSIETLKLQTLTVREVGPDEVLIRVESAGVAADARVLHPRRVRGVARGRSRKRPASPGGRGAGAR